MDAKNSSLQTLFQDIYGSAVMESPELRDYLPSADPQRLTIGRMLSEDAIDPHFKLMLLQGKIRVLHKSSAGKEQTVLFLEPGDIWDSDLLGQDSLIFAVSTEEVLLCPIPSSLIESNPLLYPRWQAVVQKSAMLQMFVERDVPMSPASAAAPQGAPRVAPPEMQQMQAAPKSSQAWACFESALLHYGKQRPKSPSDPPEMDMSALAHRMEANGFYTKQETLAWAQLLNADFPLILLDDEAVFRWITGRQGNTLLETHHGVSGRFLPPGDYSKASFKVLFLKPLSSKKLLETEVPFSLAWYISLCLQNWFLSAQMVLSSLFIQLLTLGMPIFYMVIFDRVFGHQNLSTLDVMGAGILIMLLFELSVRLIRAYVLSHQLEGIDKASMEIFLERVFNIPLSKAGPQMTRSFTERFPELIRMNQAVASTLLLSSLDVVFSVLLVAFLLLLHTKLALISLASLLPIAVMSFWSTPVTKKRATDFTQDQRTCQIKLTEALENSETIHSLNADKLFKWQLVEKIEDHLHKGFGARFDRIGGTMGQNFIAQLGGVITLYFGAHEVLQGTISYGVYMAINMLSRQVIGSIQRMFSTLLQFQEAMGTMEQFKALYQMEEEVPTTQGVVLQEVYGRIRVVDLSFRYQTEAPWVLKDLNLEILPGQKIVLAGQSGAGKTSLIRLLQRLYEPQSGYILLDGFNLADMDVENLRQHVGVALQKPAIFAGTLRDNIALGNPTASMKEIVEAASMAQLDQVLLQHPQGFDAKVASMGVNLSGGEVARVAVARIFLKNPSVLVLDEALAPCDPTLHAAIFTSIFEKYRHATCVFVTDFIPLHQRADKIIVLHEGRIVEQGTYPELIHAKGYYTHLYHTQLASVETRL